MYISINFATQNSFRQEKKKGLIFQWLMVKKKFGRCM